MEQNLTVSPTALVAGDHAGRQTVVLVDLIPHRPAAGQPALGRGQPVLQPPQVGRLIIRRGIIVFLNLNSR